jgi:2-phosphosulfolactate phosphatase
MSWETQDGFAVRFDWGPGGVARLAPHVEVLVVVDVLRFTTAVDTAVGHGVVVHPYRWNDDTARHYAASVSAVVADDGDEGPSLCPASLRRLPPGSSVVLPSPNGATCALQAAALGTTVVAGCVRNAAAVARWARRRSSVVGVVACGETWHDGSLWPAVEDLLGAAAVICDLAGERSPEALVAEAALAGVGDRLEQCLAGSSSGLALHRRGHGDDVEWAAQVSASTCVPVLADGRFVAAS